MEFIGNANIVCNECIIKKGQLTNIRRFMRLKALAVMFMALLMAGCSDKIEGNGTELSADNCIGSWRLTSYCNSRVSLKTMCEIK